MMNTELQTTLLLLLAGHVLADFVFQTRDMVEGKRDKTSALLLHGLEVFLVHAALLIPFHFDSGRALIALLAITCLHVLTDWAKIKVEGKWGPRLAWFALDQVLHVLAIALVLSVWNACVPIEALGNSRVPIPWIQAGCALSISYGFAIHGGNAIVALLLNSLRGSSDPKGPTGIEGGAGKLIGILERLIIVTLVWQGEWGAMGFVLAGKSIARFKELEERSFAEIYLVGTLTSFLVAGGLGGFLKWMDPFG